MARTFTSSTYACFCVWWMACPKLTLTRPQPSAKSSLQTAVTLSIRAAFEYGGQKCSALSRLYVPRSLWPEFSKQLKSEIERIKIGDPEDPETFFGAVISKGSFDKITSYIKKAKDAGGEILVGGTCMSSFPLCSRDGAEFHPWQPTTAKATLFSRP